LSREIRFRYSRPGKGVQIFPQRLVLDQPEVKVLLSERFEGESLKVGEQVILETGAPIVWFVFPGKWHDIGRFHLADRTFTGWYTNLATPVETEGDNWSASDLFLDLWQPAKGDPIWLDEGEFETAARLGLLDSATVRRIMNERALIDLELRTGRWPPRVTRDVDLEQVLRLLAATA
jgi:predicted RNA-binding protein associated with RNAse of E/G family